MQWFHQGEEWLFRFLLTRRDARRVDEQRLACFLSRALVEAERSTPVYVRSSDGDEKFIDLSKDLIQQIHCAANKARVKLDRTLAIGEWAPR